MNQKLTYIALMLYAACYALLFGTWAAIVFNKVPGADQIVTYIQIGLGTLSGHVLTLLGPRTGSSEAPTGSQGGFARAGMLVTLAIAAAAVLSMSGCATAPGVPRQSPQQIAAQVCPATQTTVSGLLELRGLDAAAHSELVTAGQMVDAICASAGMVDLSSLKRMSDTVLPTMIRIAKAAPLDPGEHDQIVLELTVCQIVLDGALQAAQPVAP